MNQLFGIICFLAVITFGYYFYSNRQILNLKFIQQIKKDFNRPNTLRKSPALSAQAAGNLASQPLATIKITKTSPSEIKLENLSGALQQINNWTIKGDKGQFLFPATPPVYLGLGESLYLGVSEIVSDNKEKIRVLNQKNNLIDEL